MKTKTKKPTTKGPHRSTLHRRRKKAEATALSTRSQLRAELEQVGLPSAAAPPTDTPAPPPATMEVDPDPTPPPELEPADPPEAGGDEGATTPPAESNEQSKAETTGEDGSDSSSASETEATPPPSSSLNSSLGQQSPHPPHVPTTGARCYGHRHAPVRCVTVDEEGKQCPNFVYPPLGDAEALEAARVLPTTVARAYLRGAEPPPLTEQEEHEWAYVLKQFREMYGFPTPGHTAFMVLTGLTFHYAARVQDAKGARSTTSSSKMTSGAGSSRSSASETASAPSTISQTSATTSERNTERDADDGDDRNAEEAVGALRRGAALPEAA